VAESLSVELLKVQKVFDVRWCFSSLTAVKAILRDFSALCNHFDQCGSADNERTKKEKTKYCGLAKKLKSRLLVSEACMLKDALRCLKNLSLYLQSNSANVIDAVHHINSARQKLLAMKDENGTSVGKFMDSFDADHSFKGVTITKKEGDEETFAKLKRQFFQALSDNLQQRFPSGDFLQSAACLNPHTWPADPLQRALFGDKAVAQLCKGFDFTTSDAGLVIVGALVGKNLTKLLNLLHVLPISSAECERGFSQMNLYHTKGRNRLLVSSVNNMLMVGINGPPLETWNAAKYVVSWLKAGHHGALDESTGPPKQKVAAKHSAKLFDSEVLLYIMRVYLDYYV